MRRWIAFAIVFILLLGATACREEEAPESSDTVAGAPALIGLSYDDIMNTPAFAAFTIEKSEQYSDTVEAGIVTDQDPGPGQSMRSNVIRVVVSKGPRYQTTTTAQILTKKVPSVTDEFLETAVDDLKKEGFSVDLDEVEYINHDSYNRGVVVEQEPAAGSFASTDTPIRLKVASGFTDATVTVTFPSVDQSIDLEIYVDSQEMTESELNVPLTGLLVKDLQSFSFRASAQKASYPVEIRAAVSGTDEFKTYAIYTVDGNTGSVKQTAVYDLP